jgi:hypothetical protein
MTDFGQVWSNYMQDFFTLWSAAYFHKTKQETFKTLTKNETAS